MHTLTMVAQTLFYFPSTMNALLVSDRKDRLEIAVVRTARTACKHTI